MSMDYSQEFLEKYIKDNKHEIYSDSEIFYKISTGSLALDIVTGGGIHPGMHRFCGHNEGGKTSEALMLMQSFLETRKEGKGIFIRAEGRGGENVRSRCSVKFVSNPKDWVNGTCFILDTNIYETICDFIEELVKDNLDKNNYFILLDSLDGLILKEDSKKKFDVSSKVAGVPLLTSRLMQKLSLPIGKYGHIVILTSQVRQDIKIDMYAKTPVRQTSASGGNAALHFADWIWQFEARYQGDLILQNPSLKKPDNKTNPIIGHRAKVTIKKSPNETTNMSFSYPIRYHRKAGESIWAELEIADTLRAYDLITSKGAWCYFSEEIQSDLKSKCNLTLPEKINGMNAVYTYLEENKDVSKALYGILFDRFVRK